MDFEQWATILADESTTLLSTGEGIYLGVALDEDRVLAKIRLSTRSLRVYAVR